MTKKVVAVDFDGVIVEYNGWNGHEHVDKVIKEHKPRKWLSLLKKHDFVVIIYTCRSLLIPVCDCLSDNDIPYDYINANPFQPETVSEHKILADYYIDDRFPNFVSLPNSVKKIFKIEGINWNKEKTMPCPECGAMLTPNSGCFHCMSCGFDLCSI